MGKTIAVIDGNSLMHRAYHAIQTPMVSSDGTPTNAVFGFLQMVCKFLEEAKPDALVCAFDAGKPEHRIADLPSYKAQRPHMDDELRVQFPVIEELLTSMNVPVIKVPGWEGDDILGTIAKRDERLGFKTLLVTGDKDACQLATELTRVVTTKKGISDVVIFGPNEVMEKYGVTPDQFIDYLGLMGDSSDNIPGVPGIGSKSATSLLERFENIEGVYAHIDELKGKQKENLEENEDIAYLSRQIATIVTDLDFPLDLEGISFPSFDSEEVQTVFKKYSLASPLTRVLALVGEKPVADLVTLDFGDIIDESNFERLINEASKTEEFIGIAFEKGMQESLFEPSVKIAFGFSSGNIVLEGDKAISGLKAASLRCNICALGMKDVLGLLFAPDTSIEAQITDDELDSINGYDLGLAAYLLDSTSSGYSYEKLADKFLNGHIPEDLEGSDLLCAQASLCRQLKPVMDDALKKDSSENVLQDIDMPLTPVLMKMERTGVELDMDILAELGRQALSELTTLADSIYKIAGEEFNIDSPKQLSHILFEVMGLVPIKKNSRGYSTDASVMKELAKENEIASLVLKYRELSKINSTYIESLPKMKGYDSRLHTAFNQTVTATGRLSSSDPNLQNIPVRTEFGRRIRECFIPLNDNSVFLSADYSQIELRLLAHLSEDEHLVDAFTSGTDFHARTASRVFGIDETEVTLQMRSRAKAVNFGIVYGQQAYGLSQSLDIPMAEAKEMIERYFAAYPKVREYLDKIVASAYEQGYSETMFGRKRHIPELRSSNRQQKGVGERTAMNHPMQGSAADIIKLAMIRVDAGLKSVSADAKLLLQVHDELDLSVPKSDVEEVAAFVKETMESVVSLKVPLLVDASWGKNWAEAH